MSQKAILIAIIIAAILFGGYWFLSQTKQSNQGFLLPTPTQSIPPGSVVSPSISPATGVFQTNELSVEGTEFKFSPDTINLKKDESVKLTFKNTGKFPHNLVISDLDVTTKTIQPGESDSIEFTPNKSGSFTFVCTVDAHADKGMKGTATIQE